MADPTNLIFGFRVITSSALAWSSKTWTSVIEDRHEAPSVFPPAGSGSTTYSI
jgi:hypothetical protein